MLATVTSRGKTWTMATAVHADVDFGFIAKTSITEEKNPSINIEKESTRFGLDKIK